MLSAKKKNLMAKILLFFVKAEGLKMFEPTTDFKGNWILGVIQMFKFSKSAVAEEFEKIE